MLPAERLAQQFLERHPEAATEVLSSLVPAEQAQALARLETPVALALLLRLPALTVARILAQFDEEKAASLLSVMPLRNAADILRRVAPAQRARYLAVLPARLAGAVRNAIERVQDSVAALMDRHVACFSVDASVEQAMQQPRQDANESGCHIYVTDVTGRFAGVLSLRQLFASHPQLRLGSFSVQPLTALPEAARSSSVLGHPAWLRHTQLPVVDAGGRFVGVLRRERLTERSLETPSHPSGLLGTGLALLEGYATANAVLLELLMQGSDKRG